MQSSEWRPEDGNTRIDELKFGDALAELLATDAPKINPVNAVRASRKDV